MLVLFIVLALVVLLLVFRKHALTIESGWRHFYDGLQFSTKDFYASVEEALRNRGVEKLSYAQESFFESHVFAAKRLYLRITQAEFVFYICVAPFASGTFVSWWLCRKNETLINRLPIINKLAGKDRDNKTFYQMDTEAMYRLLIHNTVTTIADELAADKGYRLTEFERQLHMAKQ